jgi:hypothetical protein
MIKIGLPPILAYQPLGHIRVYSPEQGKQYRARCRVLGEVRYSRRKWRTAEGAEIYCQRLIQRLREKAK